MLESDEKITMISEEELWNSPHPPIRRGRFRVVNEAEGERAGAGADDGGAPVKRRFGSDELQREEEEWIRISCETERPRVLESGEKITLISEEELRNSPHPPTHRATTLSDHLKLQTAEERLQHMLDECDLRHLYKLWFAKGGGRQEEAALLQAFRNTASPDLHKYIDTRFQSILHQAFQLEEDDEDTELLSACEAAIRLHNKYDVRQFINLQRVVVGAGSTVGHDQILFSNKVGLNVLKHRAAAGQYDKFCGPVKVVVPMLVNDLAANVPDT